MPKKLHKSASHPESMKYMAIVSLIKYLIIKMYLKTLQIFHQTCVPELFSHFQLNFIPLMVPNTHALCFFLLFFCVFSNMESSLCKEQYFEYMDIRSMFSHSIRIANTSYKNGTFSGLCCRCLSTALHKKTINFSATEKGLNILG